MRGKYKENQFDSGSSGFTVVIKYITSVTALSRDTCERIVTISCLYLDPKAKSTSQAVIAIARCIELNAEAAQVALVSTVESLIIEDSKQSLVNAFAVISTLFHLNPDMGRAVFSIEPIQKKQFNEALFVSEQVVVAALEALSSACVDKESRAAVAANFGSIVGDTLNVDKPSVKLLAASILVKTKATEATTKKAENTKEIAELSEIFESFIANYDSKCEENMGKYYTVALEGLAYTSLITEVKKRVISRPSIITNLVDILKSHIEKSPWVYCAVVVLANVTEYAPKLTPEQAKMRELKGYAGKSGVDNVVLEDDKVVAARNKTVLDTGVTGMISQNAPRFTQSSRRTVAILLRNLAVEKAHRATIAQQGGLAVLLYLIVQSSSADTKFTLDAVSQTITASAMAKILISVDPAIALSGKISPLATIPPLIEQLSAESSEVPLLDIFEALLALTNLAAVDDSCRDKIIREGFTRIDTLLTNANQLVQRASVELVCNLAMSPLCAEKFLDGSGPARSRLEIVSLLTDVDDRPTRLAAAGALAVLSEWGKVAAEEMVKVDRLWQKVFQLLEESDRELLLRAVVVIQNVIEGGQTDALKTKGTADALGRLVRSCRDSEVVSIAMDSYKKLQ
ncbi:hypothetical protein TRVA0_011S01332 [Trichomonascus vanleenenianus]|uniref:She4p n=1 Tax=Trichomonascus vanleenenianus TaxID=2268995 RepID=UPI003ECB39E1